MYFCHSTCDVQVTALQYACTTGSAPLVRILLRSGATPHAKVIKNGPLPALHLAARGGALGVCQALLDAGVDPNLATDVGRQPVHFAAMSGNTSVLSLLVECGANVNATDKTQSTALAFCSLKVKLYLHRITWD